MRSFLITLLIITALKSQLYSQCWWYDVPDLLETNPAETRSSCSRNSTCFTQKYNVLSNYIPSASTPIIYIPINFNIFQNASGTSNFPNNSTSISNLNQIFNWMNAYFINNTQPSDPIAGVSFIPDTRIRFVLNNIYFYKDTLSNNISVSTSLSTCLNRIRQYDNQRMNQLNICFTDGYDPNASGYSMLTSFNSMSLDLGVLTYQKYNNGDNVGYYATAGHLAHELLHNLYLNHTYKNSCCPDICDISNSDFLDDVFIDFDTANCPLANKVDGCDICYHTGGFNCDPYSPNNTCTNNIMGGTQYLGYFSPKQMGRIHKALKLSCIARYSYAENSNTVTTIDTSEHWDFNLKFYTNLSITNNSTVRVGCELLLPKDGIITIDSGSTLIFEGNTTINNYSIIVKSGGNLSIKTGANVILTGSGIIDVRCNGKFCIESNSILNCTNFINNVYLHTGYIIPSGCLSSFTSTVTGNGTIRTSTPNVLITGTQTSNQIYFGNTVSTNISGVTIPSFISTYVWGENAVNIYENFQVESNASFEINSTFNSCQ